MKILVTGCKGQLGFELMRQGEDFDTAGADLPEADITQRAAVKVLFDEHTPDLVINAAAYTAVDKAESDVETAYAVNRNAPALLAQTCAEMKIPLIHVSTDFVFDGEKRTPYTETDPVNPIGVYGKSKADGEAAVREHLDRHIIIRTAWLYSAHGHNFVKTMIRLAGEKEELNVVADQFGNPTCASDLAGAVLKIAAHIREGKKTEWGTYHYGGKGITTWHGFARAAIEMAGEYTDIRVRNVNPIPTDRYPTPAKRPAYSAMDCELIRTRFGVEIRPWEESLRETVERIFGTR